MFLLLAEVQVPESVKDVALRLVLSNVVLNPIFHGLCRKNYRKGYRYVIALLCHYLTCRLVKKPGGEQLSMLYLAILTGR